MKRWLEFFEHLITIQIVRVLEQDAPSPACEIGLCPRWSTGTVAWVIAAFEHVRQTGPHLLSLLDTSQKDQLC